MESFEAIDGGQKESFQDNLSSAYSRTTSTGISRDEVAVVIPAYNEEVTIGSVVLKALKYCNELYVVNDGSFDLTSEVAELAGAIVIEMEHNSGKAAALMKGLHAAKRDGYSVIVMMDGDEQHKSNDMPALLAPIMNGSADVVIGSRFMKEDNKIPAYRQAGQKVLNTFTNIGSRGKLTDTQSGYRALGPKALENLDFHSSGYSVESDMITHFTNRGLTIVEVPVSVRYDVPNGHKQGSTSMGFRLLENVITTVAYKRPLQLFGVPGLTLFIMGLGLGSLSFWDINIFHTWLYQLVVSAGLMTVGVIMIMFGLMQNSLAMLLRMESHKPNN
jgi:glycosyltransferase involved in cell wall biosynthesis